MAKRIQHWRSMVEFDAGHTVSSNVAPATRTRSVMSNQAFTWAFGGMPYFKPHVIFDEDTCSTLMAALLISDTTSELSPVRLCNKIFVPYLTLLPVHSPIPGIDRNTIYAIV